MNNFAHQATIITTRVLGAGISVFFTGRSSAWLERMVWDHEVAGSNPVAPTVSQTQIGALVANATGIGIRTRIPRGLVDCRLCGLLQPKSVSDLSAGDVFQHSARLG